MGGDARLLALRLLARVLPSSPELLAPTALDLMCTLGDSVWHTPPPPLTMSDGTTHGATSSCEEDAGADAGAEGGGRGLCVSSVSLCGEGGEWAWGDDAVSMARLPLHGIGVAVAEQRCLAEEERQPPPPPQPQPRNRHRAPRNRHRHRHNRRRHC